MPQTRQKKIESLPKEKREQIEGIVDSIGAVWLDEFMEYIRSPWKMLWPNFVAWIARGFGALVWVAIVITLVWWILSTVISLPLIGKWLSPYVEQVQYEFNKYTEATNYKENFERIEGTLKDIRTELRANPPKGVN